MARRKYWNVWIDGYSRTNYFRGRDTIEAKCGRSGGSGMGLGGWDVSYHGHTKEKAWRIAKAAIRLKCVKRVRVYQDDSESEATLRKNGRISYNNV